MTAPHVWKKLGPLAYAWRERDPSNPRWADLEYLVFDSLNKAAVQCNRYSASFRTRIQLDHAFEDWRLEAEGALSRQSSTQGGAPITA